MILHPLITSITITCRFECITNINTLQLVLHNHQICCCEAIGAIVLVILVGSGCMVALMQTQLCDTFCLV